ncbi:MAG: hypothetical protein DI544_01075 [Sphingomonas taxi]|uniref:Uncharacterized protein n=1 Tax=Sphingomonas taxi TaxID=1549858 RepID=A0A2W5R6I6_9SPHN|nr:MAG: hypothetical protein DI544_01075 [Sphingomonas taxi]
MAPDHQRDCPSSWTIMSLMEPGLSRTRARLTHTIAAQHFARRRGIMECMPRRSASVGAGRRGTLAVRRLPARMPSLISRLRPI